MTLFEENPALFEKIYHKGANYTNDFYLMNIVDNLIYIETTFQSFNFSIHTIENLFDFYCIYFSSQIFNIQFAEFFHGSLTG